MGKICVIKSCPSGRKKKKKTNDTPQSLSYFQPRTPARMDTWKKSLGIDLKPTDFVCQLHFKADHIKTYNKLCINGEVNFFPTGKKMLKEEALPTTEHQYIKEEALPTTEHQNIPEMILEYQERVISKLQEQNSICSVEQQEYYHIERDNNKQGELFITGDYVWAESCSQNCEVIKQEHNYLEEHQETRCGENFVKGCKRLKQTMYLQACRACLTTEGRLEKMDAATRRIYSVLTDRQMQVADGFPSCLCQECYAHIRKIMVFRRRTRRAYFVLNELLTVKKEITQSDIENVNRKKTNLLSQYSSWDPEKVIAFTYTTPDSYEGGQFDTDAQIQEALDSQDCDFDLKLDKVNRRLSVEMKTIEKKDKLSEIEKTNGIFVKHKLLNVNKACVLVDIKAAEEKKEEKTKEVEEQKQNTTNDGAILLEDNNETENNVTPVDNQKEVDSNTDNNDFNDEEIDLQDVFKGLKEVESESEIESPGEMETEETKEKMNGSEDLDSENRIYTHFFKVWAAKALVNCEIRYLSPKEQLAVHKRRMHQPKFIKAKYKCALCLTAQKSLRELKEHVSYHNAKVSFKDVCKICRDRFSCKEDLYRHYATVHWYEYTCNGLSDKHYTLESLIECQRKHNYKCIGLKVPIKSLPIEENIIIKPLRQEEFGLSKMRWSNKGSARDSVTCIDCNIRFKTTSLLAKHMKRHQPPKRGYRKYYQCDVCKLYFKSMLPLETHVHREHMHSYTCKICGDCYYGPLKAKRHLQKHFPQNQAKNKYCSICQKEFSTENSLRMHSNRAHKLDCNVCGQHATTLERLFFHQFSDHGYVRLHTVAELNDSSCVCTHCDVYFTNQKALYKHLVRMAHDEAKLYENGCQNCSVLFDSSQEYTAHKESCHSSRSSDQKLGELQSVECPYCDETLPDKRLSFVHMNRYHPGLALMTSNCKRALCELCGALCRAENLDRHMIRRHTNAVPEFCQFCNTSTPTVALYISHVLRRHTHKPYMCTLCEQRFKTRSQTRDHILKTHAPVKPYRCDICVRKFSHLDFLQHHCMQMHKFNLKKSNKSVFLPKRMQGKIYVYPHMKVDGSLLNKNILEQTPIVLCDFMDENDRIVDYRDHFFFDPDVDPSITTVPRDRRKPRCQSKQGREILRKKYKHCKRKSALRKKAASTRDNVSSEEEIGELGPMIEDIKTKTLRKRKMKKVPVRNKEIGVTSPIRDDIGVTVPIREEIVVSAPMREEIDSKELKEPKPKKKKKDIIINEVVILNKGGSYSKTSSNDLPILNEDYSEDYDVYESSRLEKAACDSLKLDKNEMLKLSGKCSETLEMGENSNENLKMGENYNETLKMGENSNETLNLGENSNETLKLGVNSNVTLNKIKNLNEILQQPKNLNELLHKDENRNKTSQFNNALNSSSVLNGAECHEELSHETQEVTGRVIERDGEYYMLVDGVLYKLESC